MKILLLGAFVLWIAPNTIHSQVINNLELVGASTEGYTPIRRDGLWGFMNQYGELVVDFRDDLVYNANPPEINANDLGVDSGKFPVLIENRTIIKVVNLGISYYGFIDATGKTIIEPQFLNVSNFHNGYALAVKVEEKLLEKNDLLEVKFQYNYNILLIDPNGELVRCLAGPFLIQNPKELKKGAPIIDVIWVNGGKLVAVKSPLDKWEIYKINL